MDVNLHTMMLQNVPSIELNRRLLQNEINSRRVAQILVDASHPDLDLLPVRNHSNRTTSTNDRGYNATTLTALILSDAVTTASSSADVTQPAGGNANKSVNLTLARKRPRTTRLNLVRFSLAAANNSVTKDDSLSRTLARRALTAVWNMSLSSANRTSAEEEWNMTLMMTNGSTSLSNYCPAIPPGLREY